MKKILTIIGVFLVLASFTYAQSPFLTYRFANPVIKAGSPDTLIFDVQAKCDVTGTYHEDLSVYLNYNSAAFGTNVAANGKIFLVRSGLTSEELFFPGSGIFKYNFLPIADNTSSRVAFGTESALGPTTTVAYLTAVPTTFTTYLKVKLVIADIAQLAGLSFQASLMNGNQFYSTTTTLYVAYGNCAFDNNYLNLPLTAPTDLIISEVADPSNSSANFVEIYNSGISAVDFTSYYAYYLNVNGSSSVQLTGSLNAGGTYVIANNAADFTTAYPGKPYSQVSSLVGTGGTNAYTISIFGNYSGGTELDDFSGFDFTGKHAVRHYSVVAPNSTPTASEWVFSAAQNMDMTPGSHRMTLNWDGSVMRSTEWRDTANWSASYVPDAAHNVVIPNNGVVPVVGNGDNAYTHNLTINSGAGLIVQSHQTLGDGSIITYGTVTGSATVQRYLGADRYYYISQPVTSALAGVFLHIWMFTYSETAGNWTAFIEPASTPLNLMKGYAVWTSSINSWSGSEPPIGDTTVGYVGTLNTGTNSVPLTFTTSGGPYGNGWNFVGNCFPSAVDWEAAGWTKTGLATNAYSVWNGTTYGTYTAGVGGTNGATRYIPAAQGYFVQTSAAGSLGMTNAVRTHSTQAFWKSDENKMNLLSLTVTDGNINDETIIYFNENATTTLDYDYDARKLMAPAAPQLYTMMSEERMAINSFNNMTETPTVKMGVNVPETGEYTITASNIESFDANIPIYLEDLVTSQIVSLRETGSYTFSGEEGTAERFLVHFSEVQGIGDPANDLVTSIYAVDHKVYVNFKGISGEIAVYNILGGEISRCIATNGLNMVPVHQGNAVYIVKVISDNTTVTKKVFVK